MGKKKHEKNKILRIYLKNNMQIIIKKLKKQFLQSRLLNYDNSKKIRIKIELIQINNFFTS